MLKKSLILITALLILACACQTSHAKAEKDLTGQAFIEITAETWLNSDPIKIADLKGKVVVAEFWATWCPPCQKSIPHLIELNEKFKEKGVVIIGLTDEGKDVVEPFAKKMNMKYPIAIGSQSGREYGVTGIPTAFVISRDGKIAWTGHPMSGLDKAIEDEAAKKAEGAAAPAETKPAETAPAPQGK